MGTLVATLQHTWRSYLVGLVVKAYTSKAGDTGIHSYSSPVKSYQGLGIGYLVVTLPHTWRFHLVGLVVKVSISRAGDAEIDPRFP